MSSEPPAQKVSDEDLIRAVRDECHFSVEPMVKTETIAGRDDITIKQNSVANRLRDLAEDGYIHSVQVGRGYVWSVADEATVESPVDYSQINWNAISAEDIPEEKLHEHPDFPISNTWRKLIAQSQTLVTYGLLSVIIASVLLASRDINALADYRESINLVGQLMFIGGIVGAVIGVGVRIVGRVGSVLERRGVNDAARQGWQRAKTRFQEGVPLKIEIEWDR